MLKFIRGKGQQPSLERQKVQRELFSFKKTVQHGFPNKPSALAWDPTLRLMAIGTSSGVIKVVGKPGVEFYGQHQNNECAVTKLVFLPNQGRIVSLCADNSIHLWEINENNGTSTLEEVKIQSLEGKLKKISACCLESSAEHLLLGTEGGNIYLLNLKTFEMSETIIYQDVVMQNVPEDYKKNPGAVEAIAEQPGNPHRILIGYNRGLMVLWNRKNPGADQTYISNQQLESVSWHSSGKKFASSHNDGSYAFWDIDVGDKASEEPTTLYGPFPCKSVTKFLWRPTSRDDFILFSGGMPRASYSDRHTISVLHGKKHVVFDFTSKVIDFFTIDAVPELSEGNSEGGSQNWEGPEALIVLAEEELIAIDLKSEDWQQLTLPYLAPLHGSAITCVHHVSNVPESLWNKIVAAGKEKLKNTFSDKEWLINGGSVREEEKEDSDKGVGESGGREVLLTGHEDGSVRFWDARGISLKLLYKFASAELFSSEEGVDALDSPLANGTNQEEEEEEWPPFRKVGTFDPYSDDPRLAVKKISLCPQSGTLAVAGTAGHVVVARIAPETQGDNEGVISETPEVKLITMNIVSDRDGFVWKGHDQLSLRKVPQPDNSSTLGFQASSVLQLHPPAAITSLALNAQWGVVAAGTAHGLALFDYKRLKPVLTKCTLNPNDLSGAGEAPISRRKSFKKSLRESFRRLRKGRSQRHPAGEKRGSAASASSPTGSGDRKRKDPWSAEKGPQDDKPSSSPTKDKLDKTNASPSPVILREPYSMIRRNSAPTLTPYINSDISSSPVNIGAPNTASALPVALSMPNPQTNRASTLDSRAVGESNAQNSETNSQSLRTGINVSRPVLSKIGLECIRRTKAGKEVGKVSKELAVVKKVEQVPPKGGWQRIRALVMNRKRATTPTRIAPWVQAHPSIPREPSKWDEISNSSLVSLGLGSSPDETSLSSLAFIDSSPVVTPISHEVKPVPKALSSILPSEGQTHIASLPIEETVCANVAPTAVQPSIAMCSPRSASGSGEVAAGGTGAASSPTSPASTSGAAGPLSPVEARPVERQVEARPLEDSLGSMVRCLYFARSFIVSVQSTTPTLWAGTNNGTVFVFTITVPNGQKRMEEDISCQLGKEIQLKHRAPVISIAVVDGSAVPLPEPLEIEKGLAPQPDNSAAHRVLICSEEQFKMFTLPSLKPLWKLKLTAHEGARVRRVGHARFYAPQSPQSTSPPHSEMCLLCLTNLGDLIVLSLPDLRRQLVAPCIRREDINGISSLAFTRLGEAFYLHSSSELQRITLSTTKVTQTSCYLVLPENARPKVQVENVTSTQNEAEGEPVVAAEEAKEEVVVEGVVSGDPSEEAKQQESSAPSSEATTIKEEKKDEVAKPTVNGNAEDKKVESQVEVGKVVKRIEVTTTHISRDDGPKENGGTIDDEDLHDLSTGDITIDSVKDHLISSMNDESRIVELKTEKFEVSSSKVESSVIVKTTTISSSEVATVVNSSGEISVN